MSATKQRIRTVDEIRDEFMKKLAGLIEQARLTLKNTSFMKAQIDDLLAGVTEGAQDTDRMRYLASDRETLRAIYDHIEIEGEDGEFSPIELLRDTIDTFNDMDVEGELDVE